MSSVTAPASVCLEPIAATLRRAVAPAEVWLWCLHCERFFQARSLRRDFLDNQQGCAFIECDGAGFDIDIFAWDAWRDADDPRWPASTAALRHGQRSPGHDPVLAAARLARARDAAVEAYAASPEHAGLATGRPPRWVPDLVEVMVELGSASDVVAEVFGCLLLDGVARRFTWSPADAEPALAEVCAYLAHVVRTHPDACGDAERLRVQLAAPAVAGRFAAALAADVAPRRARIGKKARRRR